MNSYAQDFVNMFSFLWDKHLGVGLLGQRIGACLPLREIVKLFSEVAIHCIVPQAIQETLGCSTSVPAFGVNDLSVLACLVGMAVQYVSLWV